MSIVCLVGLGMGLFSLALFYFACLRLAFAAPRDCDQQGKPHLFSLAPNAPAAMLCVPQKNGNRNWAGFIFYLHNRRAPINVDEVLDAMSTFELKKGRQGDDVYVVARDPYSRALSNYLNHEAIGGCVGSSAANGGQLGCKTADAADTHAQKRAASPQRFEAWLEAALAGGADAACQRDRHMCAQTTICGLRCLDWPPVILQLEQQPRWFGHLLQRLDVKRSKLVGDAWRSFSGQPGFYFEPTGDAVVLDAVHATNATGRLGELYTNRTIDLVDATYHDDFCILDYCKGRHCIAEAPA